MRLRRQRKLTPFNMLAFYWNVTPAEAQTKIENAGN